MAVRRQQLQRFEHERAGDHDGDAQKGAAGVAADEGKSQEREGGEMLSCGLATAGRSSSGESVAKAMKASTAQLASRNSRWFIAGC